MATAYIAVGANLGEPRAQAESALLALAQLATTRIIARSSWYRSASLSAGQPDYLNGVVQVETTLTPAALLQAMQAIETAHGRVRLQHWGPRTLDLDLLLYDDRVLDTPFLTLPHPQLTQRNFVVVPLLEVNPALQLPDGRRLADLATGAGQGGLAPWEQNQ